jgi:hypothetical protein
MPRSYSPPIRIVATAYHRNGVSGAPFHAVLFEDANGENTRKLAILFEQPSCCAVLDVARLANGDIAFGSNSYRGDVFEERLRAALQSPTNPTERT